MLADEDGGVAAGAVVAPLPRRGGVPWRGRANELATTPDALEHLRLTSAGSGWSAGDSDWYLRTLSKAGPVTAYLFRCRHCGSHLAYSDSA